MFWLKSNLEVEESWVNVCYKFRKAGFPQLVTGYITLLSQLNSIRVSTLQCSANELKSGRDNHAFLYWLVDRK